MFFSVLFLSGQLIRYFVSSDFTGISKFSSIEKFRLGLAFSNVVGLGNAGKVLNLLFREFSIHVFKTIFPSINS